ncbi:tripartite tricarboxylate transporter substrate binding protein [Inquilinus sp. CAU 1745]|uniref:Bug family tripartite tricarboxylate transporter substrate binding protein n=1 Tax=Inquilinus sp. CAU 1745 TaxID=3140369 RepID=UPI00325C2DE2
MKIKLLNRSRSIVAGVVATAAGLGIGAAQAQDFPSKDIEVIVPYSAGGGTDNFVRALEPSLEEALGTNIIVRNVTGGGGAVGLMQALAAEPDGYTVTIPNNALYTLQGLGNVDFEYEDFDYIARITTEPYVLVVRNIEGWEDLESFVESATTGSNQVKLGFAGVGSSSHIMTMAVADALGIEPSFVPYDGGSTAVAAAMGGHIDGVVLSPSDVVSAVEGDTLHTLATTGDSSLLPGTPTFASAGYDLTAHQWRGIGTPAGLDESVKAVWVEALKEAVEDESFQAAIQNLGSEVAPLYGEELKAFVDEMADLMIPLAEQVKQ